MIFDPPLIEARLERRYKRFLADVTLAGSEETVTAHCPNPGAMTGLDAPGSPCWVSRAADPKRKLAWTLELVEADDVFVGINTGAPNKLAEEAIAKGRIPALSGYATARREVRYGTNSRIDLLLQDHARPDAFVEVKNVHLMRAPGLAEFPDSVTARGAKHLAELAAVARSGRRAVQLFIIQRPDCARLALAADIDPGYAAAMAEAVAAGVEVMAWACDVSPKGVVVAREAEVAL